jgi:hypothetical protein
MILRCDCASVLRRKTAAAPLSWHVNCRSARAGPPDSSELASMRSAHMSSTRGLAAWPSSCERTSSRFRRWANGITRRSLEASRPRWSCPFLLAQRGRARSPRLELVRRCFRQQARCTRSALLPLAVRQGRSLRPCRRLCKPALLRQAFGRQRPGALASLPSSRCWGSLCGGVRRPTLQARATVRLTPLTAATCLVARSSLRMSCGRSHGSHVFSSPWWPCFQRRHRRANGWSGRR